MEGPQGIAKYARTDWAREQLERGTGMGDAIYAQYWRRSLMLDLVDFVSSIAMFFFPPAKTVGLVAGRPPRVGRLHAEVGTRPPRRRVHRARRELGRRARRRPLRGPVRKRRGRRSSRTATPSSPPLHDILERYGHEPGVSLDLSTKARLERFLGRDLGDVRLHTGPLARELARETEAEALTVGRDIYLPSEDLGGPRGLELLAHEGDARRPGGARVARRLAALPRSGRGASRSMEDVARSIESRFASGGAGGLGRASAYPVLAEPAVREAPQAPAAAAAAAPGPASPVLETAASAPAPVASAPHRRAAGDAGSDQTPGFDPVRQVMQSFHVPPSVSQEEFLAICTERLVELVKDELAGDGDRRESLAWNHDLPNA